MNDSPRQPDSRALRDDLRAIAEPRRELSAGVRERVLAHAAAARGRRRPTRAVRPLWRRRWAVAGVAAAACVLLVVGPRVFRDDSPLAGDVDGDGVVDVRDAYLLARSVRAAQPIEARADLDGDGRVDQADVDRLLDRIVRLEEGRS